MKKIINGKTYNTETAEWVVEWNNGMLRGDFDFVEETLYITKRNDYFIYGEGGARTIYAERDGDMWRGSWGIRPVTLKEVREWIRRHNIKIEDEAETVDGVMYVS